MMGFDWKSAVRAVAPTLGAVISATGPAGVLVGGAISVLGKVLLGDANATEDQVAQAVAEGKLSGDNVVALRKADQDFKVEMARIDLETDKAHLADTSDARRQTIELAKTDSPLAWGAAIISALIVVGFFTCVYLLFIVERTWDERTANLMNVLFGALTVSFTQVANYWLGSSAGSKRASDSIRKIAEGKG